MDSKSKKSSKILKSIVEKKIRRKKNVDSTTKTRKSDKTTRKSTNERQKSDKTIRKSTNERQKSDKINRKSTNERQKSDKINRKSTTTLPQNVVVAPPVKKNIDEQFHDCHRVFLNYANKKYRLYSEISDDLDCKNLPKIFDYCKKLGSTPEKVLIKIYRDIMKKETKIF